MAKVNGETALIKAHRTRWLLYWFWSLCTAGAMRRNHFLAVTETRVILKKGILSKQERSANLDRIQDVTVKKGLFGRILGYGDLTIETAGGAQSEFVFKRITKPDKVRDAIYRAQEQYRARLAAEQQAAMQQAVAQATAAAIASQK